jgi:hypothetical protein
MRIESSVTSISWIPSEMIEGPAQLPFRVGVTHHDVSPPERLDEAITDALERLRAGDRFRIANHLAAWVEVDDGVVIGHGQRGGGLHGSTIVRAGRSWSVPAVRFPDLRPEPVFEGGGVRFRQTVGGRTGVPAPRRIDRRPYVQVTAPPAWTTLELTLHADGRCDASLVGASPFPRHWVYDHAGRLIAKSGVVDFHGWYQHQSVERCPWSGHETAVAVAGPSSELEYRLAERVMHGPTAPAIRAVDTGELLMRQGDLGREIALLLDGVARVVVDGRDVAELGPGAIIGERATLESGCRTATLVAVTACKIALVGPDRFDTSTLDALSRRHRREHERRAGASVS